MVDLPATCFHSHAASVGFSAASYNSMEPEQTTPEDRERQRQILDATIESILPRDCSLLHHSWDETFSEELRMNSLKSLSCMLLQSDNCPEANAGQ